MGRQTLAGFPFVFTEIVGGAGVNVDSTYVPTSLWHPIPAPTVQTAVMLVLPLAGACTVMVWLGADVV